MNDSDGITSGLAQACAHALVGRPAESLDLEGVHTPDELLVRLREQGWGPIQISQVKTRCLTAGDRWPLEGPAQGRRTVGFAQLHAWVWQCVDLLGFDAVDAGVRDAQSPLDAEDRRLLGERPPHHGSVG